MNYPDWAPAILIKRHKQQLENINSLATDMEEEDLVPNFQFPIQESTELLGKLLTDIRMKSAWLMLGKRIADDTDYNEYFQSCLVAITNWRRNRKLSPSSRIKELSQIRDCAIKLHHLLYSSQEMQYYSIVDSLSPEEIHWFLESLDSGILYEEKLGLDYARFVITELLTINRILLVIGMKANSYASQNPLVMKPNSSNADAHYFIRYISTYLNNKYGQPLHEIVATTASITFDRESIDEDLVRKLVKYSNKEHKADLTLGEFMAKHVVIHPKKGS